MQEATSLTLYNRLLLYSIVELSTVKTNFDHLVIYGDIVHTTKGINLKRLH